MPLRVEPQVQRRRQSDSAIVEPVHAGGNLYGTAGGSSACSQRGSPSSFRLRCRLRRRPNPSGGSATAERPSRTRVRELTMSGRTIGNLILMTLICVVVFIVFMAVRPTKASAQNLQREAELSDLARPYHPATVLHLISPEAVTCS